MAVDDDLNRLAQDAVVYLTRKQSSTLPQGQGGAQNNPPAIVYRGRLRQALDGSWVFNTSVGTNGVAGITFSTATGTWGTQETPAGGIQVIASWVLIPGTQSLLALADGSQGVVDQGNGQPVGIATLMETIILSDVIPADLAD
jgi:hypothetical protein